MFLGENNAGFGNVNAPKQGGQFGNGEFKMCLEHLKPKSMNCVECKVTVCESCAQSKQHAGHRVYQQRDLMSQIEQRMDILMTTFQLLENQCNSLQDS